MRLLIKFSKSASNISIVDRKQHFIVVAYMMWEINCVYYSFHFKKKEHFLFFGFR